MSAKKSTTIPESKLNQYNRLVSGLSGIEIKGASMPYTSVNGHMFSFLDKEGNLSLRLPDAAREAFIREFKTRLSEQHGTVLKEYVLVPDDVFKKDAVLVKYFELSLEYVRGLKPKPTKK